MEREEKVFAVLAALGLLILVANALFAEKTWYAEHFSGLVKTDTHRSGTVGAMLLIGAALAGWAVLANTRNESPKMLSHNDITTWNPIHDRPIPAGEFYIIPRGGIVAMGMTIKGRAGVNVVHRDAFHEIGSNCLLNAQLTPRPLGFLPPTGRDAIRARGLVKGPYYFGLATEFVAARETDYSKETRQLETESARQDIMARADLGTNMALDKRIAMLEVIVADKGHGPVVKGWRKFKERVGLGDGEDRYREERE